MLKLPLHIAKKLLRLLHEEISIPGSEMKHSSVIKMLEDGFLQKKQIGKTKALLFIADKTNTTAYLHNHFGINSLETYINALESEEQSRAINIAASGNSKLQSVRTFKGFLINNYDAINTTLNGKSISIHPAVGSYVFIHDYENFIPDPDVTVVGIENPENFRQIEKIRYLFADIKTLFVSRYPQSNDLLKWLSLIPNNYLHFGDMDFAGINIYQSEFKKHLGGRATFFIPPGTEELLQKFGNKELFNKQYSPLYQLPENAESSIGLLLQLLVKYKKVLEQEIFIQ